VFENSRPNAWVSGVPVWKRSTLPEARTVDGHHVMFLLERLAHRRLGNAGRPQPVHANQRRPGAATVNDGRHSCRAGRRHGPECLGSNVGLPYRPCRRSNANVRRYPPVLAIGHGPSHGCLCNSEALSHFCKLLKPSHAFTIAKPDEPVQGCLGQDGYGATDDLLP